jgi:hypothetical protein
MKKENILKQEIMLGLLFVLVSLIISWLLFIKPVFDEKSSLILERDTAKASLESREIKVTPNRETVLSIQYSKKPLDEQAVLSRVLRAENASNTNAQLSLKNGQAQISLTANSAQKELFLNSLTSGPRLQTDGQIKNKERVPLLPIQEIIVTPDTLKVSGQ